MGGSLNDTEITEILTLCKPYTNQHIDTFIETGTYKGDSTLVASNMFKTVYTIEINQDRYNESIQRFTNSPNIHAYLGDSTTLLPSIMSKITTPCMWFLDAHQSGHDTSNNGLEWVPLLTELEKIFGGEYHHTGILVVDDVRLFSNAWDWENISFKAIDTKLVIMGYTIAKKYIANDRYVLVVV